MTVVHEIADTGSSGNLLLASARYGCAWPAKAWSSGTTRGAPSARTQRNFWPRTAFLRGVRYLDDRPSAAEIAHVLTLLGTADPRVLMQTSEPRYEELGWQTQPPASLSMQ